MVSLVGCGASVSNSYDMSAPMAANGISFDGFASKSAESAIYGEMEYVEEDSGYEEPKVEDTQVAKEKLVYSSRVSMETKDMDAALSLVYDMIDKYGAIVQDENLYNMDSIYNDPEYIEYSRYTPAASANIFVRVPQKNYDTFLEGLNNSDSVLYVTETSKNVENLTKTYYDIDSRLKTLRVEEERLLHFLDNASNVSEMLDVERRLTEVQYQIDSATNQLITIDYDVEYAKVTLNIQEVLRYSDTANSKRTFGQRLAFYFKDSGSDFVVFLEKLVEIIIYIVPYCVLLCIAYFVFRKINRKYREKHPKDLSKCKKNRRNRNKQPMYSESYPRIDSQAQEIQKDNNIE